jgi:hypothetical protein
VRRWRKRCVVLMISNAGSTRGQYKGGPVVEDRGIRSV